MRGVPSHMPIRELDEHEESEKRSLKSKVQHWIHDGHGLIAIFLLILVLIGWMLSRDYGLSTDEWIHIDYAKTTLATYAGLGASFHGPPDIVFYGPFYSVLAELGAILFSGFRGGVALIAARHFMYYLSLPLSVLGIYWLCLPLVRKPAALGAAALFASQPLLFGHAFINPKDMPFMAFFILSVAAGWYAADQLTRAASISATKQDGNLISAKGPLHVLQAIWNATGVRQRILLLALPALIVFVVVEGFIRKGGQGWLLQILGLAYRGEGPEPLLYLFHKVAQDAWKTPLAAYQAKMVSLYGYGRLVVMGTLVISTLILVLHSLRRTFPASAHWSLLPTAVAGVLLGLTTDIRVAGPLAGALVTIYYLRLGFRKALVPVILYWGLAAGVTYIAWPEMWAAPLSHLVQSVELMAEFPHHSMELYRGKLVQSTSLPWEFVPYLMLLQFTIPAVILGFLGLVRGIILLARRSRIWLQIILIFLWLIIPSAAVIALRATLYSNFRQLLFVVPPIFILAGIGFEWFVTRIGSHLIGILIAVIAILPGIAGIITLHPYEYVFYNGLAGGTGQASASFETDYWCTSYKEAIEHVNLIAGKGEVVGVHRLAGLVEPFARADLKIVAILADADIERYSPDYLLVCARSDFARRFMPGWKPVWAVSRDGAELSVVRVPR
jgi:hypothetical protein